MIWRGHVTYRCLEAGEEPSPILYRQVRERTPGRVSDALLVQVAKGQPIPLRLSNSSTHLWHYHWQAPFGKGEGQLPPGGQTLLTLNPGEEGVWELRILLEPSVPDDSSEPTLRLEKATAP